MRIRVLGIQPLSFTNDSGDTVNGTNLYYGYENPNITGLQTDKMFVREDITLPDDLKPNAVLNADFSPKGKLMGFSH